jgi:hypothetical protein
MPFFVSAESGVDPISEPRQTEPAAIGFALDYIDRGFSALEIQRRPEQRQLLRGLPTGVFSHSPSEEIGKTRLPFRLRRSRAIGPGG